MRSRLLRSKKFGIHINTSKMIRREIKKLTHGGREIIKKFTLSKSGLINFEPLVGLSVLLVLLVCAAYQHYFPQYFSWDIRAAILGDNNSILTLFVVIGTVFIGSVIMFWFTSSDRNNKKT